MFKKVFYLLICLLGLSMNTVFAAKITTVETNTTEDKANNRIQTELIITMANKANEDVKYNWDVVDKDFTITINKTSYKPAKDAKLPATVVISKEKSATKINLKSSFTINKNYVNINTFHNGKFTIVSVKFYKDLDPFDLAVSGKTIVIDAGHGGSDTGAIGYSGSKEKDITLQIAKKLDQLLSKNGAKVLMTRNGDYDVYGPRASAKDELYARAKVGLDNKADMFISIHCNSFTKPTAHGTQTFYHNKSQDNKLLATAIQREMVAKTRLRDRGVSAANFYVLRYSTAPAVLVETAFISNPEEEKLLNEQAFQRTMANAIGTGISNYFKAKEK